MAFNGTKNFAKNDIVKYLESIGVRFGADLNAQTGFDETIYILPVPTDSAGILEKSFRFLGDVATGILFDSADVVAERGVVLSEWRTGLGADERIRDKQFPVIFRGSKYAERLPIGLPEVIETANPAPIRRFWRDWYRPDLMAVIAVGDADPARLEALIRQTFGAIPRRATARPRTVTAVPAARLDARHRRHRSRAHVVVGGRAVEAAAHGHAHGPRPAPPDVAAAVQRHAQPALQRALAEARGAVRGRRRGQRQSGARRRLLLARRRGEGGPAAGRAECAAHRGRAGAAAWLPAIRARSQPHQPAAVTRARIHRARQDAVGGVRRRIRRQLPLRRRHPGHRVRVRRGEGAAPDRLAGRGERARQRARGRGQPRGVGDAAEEGRPGRADGNRGARRVRPGRVRHHHAVDGDDRRGGARDAARRRRDAWCRSRRSTRSA